MSRACRVCLEDVALAGEAPYHERCLEGLFGISKLPAIDIELAKLHTLALAMVGHTTISGVQRKISAGLSNDKTTLQVALEGGRFILKPQAHTYPRLPENEHLTMRLARLAGIEIPPCGLVPLADGSLAYVVARFDRPPDGGKLRQEDFCQLAEKAPKEKYDGSAELCVRLLRQYASEPLIEMLELYRRLVFIWWTGNGDMHLKNFSLLAGRDGLQRLSPAYDLLCTRLVIPDDPLALPVQGKKDRLDRAAWLALAAYGRIGAKAAERVLASFGGVLEAAVRLVARSELPEEMKAGYEALLRERMRTLQAQAN